MDFVTHAAVGAMTGRALSQPDDRDAARTGIQITAFAALLPDADHVLEYFGAGAYLLYHRTATHSILFALAITAIVALLPGPQRARRAGLVAAGLGTHYLLDLLTPFGIGIGWPFTAAMPSLDVLPIVAPWMIALSAIGCAVMFWRGRRDPAAGYRAARIGIGVLAVFVAFEATVVERARDAIDDPGRVAIVVPDPFLPHRAVVIHEDDARARAFDVGLDGSALARAPVLLTQVASGAPLGVDAPAMVRAARDAPAVARYLARFRIPTARVDDREIVFTDAQYVAVRDGTDPVRIVVPLEASGAPDVEAARAELMVEGAQPIFWLVVVGFVPLVGVRRFAFWKRASLTP